ncbi:EamA-like transporter family [Desulfamplus magnetovallimortis]|uniref:EamA-like transporter family n=1 Tax=Desulfamplus magnetovallimortis TaxID=1246637 RepID=A0A1W1H8H1_9BACT|nr:EamA family transporter [Desulfamplus magnetovallimortis]SLM28753.1 EamA-like transporter family [Desulfamplus magnetovallimortis]
MQNLLFYTITVLIWGSTWLAIKFQLGSIDPMISVAYRFTLAAFLLMVWCCFRKLKMRFTLKDHLFMMLQGTFLFALNYWLFYIAELYLTSGLAAVIFSTILVLNMINGAIFLKNPFDSKVIAGGTLGLLGIVLVFKPELTGFQWSGDVIKGIVISLAATLLASFGNILSARNQKNKLPVIQTNAWGMTYGAILMLIISFAAGKPFVFDFSAQYLAALIYLSVFGSIVAFGCYLTLVGRIGPDRAAYATLLFPIVALIISTIWEDYHWTTEALIGVALIISGNLLILKKISLKDIRKKSLAILHGKIPENAAV